MPVQSEDQVIPCADPPNQMRRPFTSVMLTIWCFAAVAGLHYLFTEVTPNAIGLIKDLYLIERFPLALIRGVTVAAQSRFIWIFFYAAAILLPIVFTRIAWSATISQYEYRYRRLIAIHIVICFSLAIAVVSLYAVYPDFSGTRGIAGPTPAATPSE